VSFPAIAGTPVPAIDTKTPRYAAMMPPAEPGSRRRCSPICSVNARTHHGKPAAEPNTIQILLGHHDLKETAIYIHLSQRTARYRQSTGALVFE